MTLKKHLIIAIAAVSLATPAVAAQRANDYAPQEPGIIAILIGLLLPAVQKVR